MCSFQRIVRNKLCAMCMPTYEQKAFVLYNFIFMLTMKNCRCCGKCELSPIALSVGCSRWWRGRTDPSPRRGRPALQGGRPPQQLPRCSFWQAARRWPPTPGAIWSNGSNILEKWHRVWVCISIGSSSQTRTQGQCCQTVPGGRFFPSFERM